MSSGAGGGWVYVDDADSSIVYSGGDWFTSTNSGPSSSSGVFDGTLHGAQTQGITATFKFSGSEIGVVGTSGLTDEYGWPAVDFSIDGVQQYTNTFPATISHNTLFTNVTFFDSPVTPGEHILTITNLNGTAPNTFWFDYIFYAPIADTSTSSTSATSESAGKTDTGSSSPTTPPAGHGGSSASSSTAPASATSHTSVTLPASTGSASASEVTQGSHSSLSSLGTTQSSVGASGTLARVSGTSDSSTSSSTPSEAPGILHESSSASTGKHTGAIIGGVIGGIVLVILAMVLAYFAFRRRLRAWYGIDEIVPAESVEGARSDRRVTILAADIPATAPLSKEQPSGGTVRRAATATGGRDNAAVAHAASPAADLKETSLPGLADGQRGRRREEDRTGSRAKTVVRAMTSRIRSRMPWHGARVVQEVDSGLRLPAEEDIVETLPPPYSAQ